jgi:hypothetical protein
MVLNVGLRERELPTARPIAVLFDIAAATFFAEANRLPRGGVSMSSKDLADALEEVLASMNANLIDDLEDEVETASRAIKW